MLRSFAWAGVCVLVSLEAGAAAITWGPAQNIAGDSDVSTSGSLVMAYNFGGTGVSATTINGVAFQSFAVDGSANTFTHGSATVASSDPVSPAATTTFQALSPSYTTLLTSAVRLNADTPYTLTMAGLTIGKKYQFQTWVNNSNRQNGPNFLFATSVSDDQFNSVDVYAGDDGTTTFGPGIPGQYVIGTFTADATFENVLFENGEIDGWVNGFQLRELAVSPGGGGGGSSVPLPPAVWCGMALGGLALALRGRWLTCAAG